MERLLRDFSRRHELDIRNVFRDLRLYIVHGFLLPDTPPAKHWPYTPKQNRAFYGMFAASTMRQMKTTKIPIRAE